MVIPAPTITVVSEAVKETIDNDTQPGEKEALVVLSLRNQICPCVSQLFAARARGWQGLYEYLPLGKCLHW